MTKPKRTVIKFSFLSDYKKLIIGRKLKLLDPVNQFVVIKAVIKIEGELVEHFWQEELFIASIRIHDVRAPTTITITKEDEVQTVGTPCASNIITGRLTYYALAAG